MAIYPNHPVLIVDDEASRIEIFTDILKYGGIDNILTCRDSREVPSMLKKQQVDCILLDIYMPHISGLKLLLYLVENHPEIPVIIITGSDDVHTAVECMKAGACDYMVKPVEQSRLISGIKRVIELKEMKRQYTDLRRHFFSNKLDSPDAFKNIITADAKMKAIFQYIEVIAPSPETVLITGETGVGKELIARAVHTVSQRKGEFVGVNAAGLDDNMFSDTLFGHEKGAFTDAVRARSGMIQKAAGGTLFLDEIGDLSPVSQVKLLRLLQEYEYYPLGSDKPRYTDARIIFATNCDLNLLIESGRLRKDLFHRMYVHRIQVPPLRERLDDIPFLVDHFLNEVAQKLKKKKPTVPKELYPFLKTFHFPGNIRELRAMIFNAVSSHKSMMLSLKSFKEAIGDRNTVKLESQVAGNSDNTPDALIVFPGEFLPTLKQAEQVLIDKALERTGGNQSMAAQVLGLTRQALHNRLKRKKT